MAFVAAYNRALSLQNILCGFHSIDIYPFLATKVLHRVTPTSASAVEIQPATLPIPLIPFNKTVLTSSPIHFNAIHQATVALNTEPD